MTLVEIAGYAWPVLGALGVVFSGVVYVEHDAARRRDEARRG